MDGARGFHSESSLISLPLRDIEAHGSEHRAAEPLLMAQVASLRELTVIVTMLLLRWSLTESGPVSLFILKQERQQQHQKFRTLGFYLHISAYINVFHSPAASSARRSFPHDYESQQHLLRRLTSIFIANLHANRIINSILATALATGAGPELNSLMMRLWPFGGAHRWTALPVNSNQPIEWRCSVASPAVALRALVNNFSGD